MRRSLIPLFLLLVISLSCYSRQKLSLGAKGGYANTWILNQNVKSDPEVSSLWSFAPHYGAMIRYNISSTQYNTIHMGYSLEILFAQYQQKYGPGFLGDDFERQLDIYTIDIPFMYRYTIDYVVNLEIGLLASYVRLAYGNYPLAHDFIKNGEIYLLTENFSSISVAAIVRISTDIKITKKLALNPGIMYSYGFLDLISKAGGRGKDYRGDVKADYRITRTMQEGGWLGLVYRL